MDYVLSQERARRRRWCWIELALALSALAGVVWIVVR